jgi:HAD superfamily hydrolase (TIGR01509 family)
MTHSATRPVVLFDWGETLMWIPGMIHDPDAHVACLARVYDGSMMQGLREANVTLAFAQFRPHYLAACAAQIRQSKQSQREHSFADRFAMAFSMAQVSVPPRELLDALADALGEEVTREARLLADSAEVIPQLAQHYRLGVVSNYPHGPVVSATLARFNLLQYFEVVVVSSETGWMKPHGECFAPALAAMQAVPSRTLYVGDDFNNDVRGGKALGLHTAWLAPSAQNVPAEVDVHLRTLAELPAHCARLFS